MDLNDDRDTEIQALRERLSRLSEASLRINWSLDLDPVLQGVVDSARALTGARYGGVSTVDESGQSKDYVTSGMTPEEQERLAQTPEGYQFFQHLLGLTTPLRIPDMSKYFSSMGLPDFDPGLPAKSLLVIALRDEESGCGTIYLSNGEDDREFTDEDEEILAMFASQATMAIANSRRYRDEQRARADLETLINTSPVGVGVFDARTGMPVSFNREATRIVTRLLNPGEPAERLLETVTVRWGDEREVSLAELSFAQLLSHGETLRAEELVLSVPNGKSMSVLANVTPMLSENGEVESTVVTLQDMTSLEESERLRAEFLGMVSHELRAPLTSIKGSVATLLDPPASLNPSEMRQYHTIIDAQVDRMHVMISDLLDVARIETGELAVSPEPTDVDTLAGEARRDFLSRGGSHQVQIELPEGLPWVMADRMRLIQVLGNLLANAARHSPGSSPIRVTAVRDGVHVAVSVHDEGRGIPAESLPLLFRKFSRVDAEDQGGDTGLGLSICKGIVEAHGGRIWAESDGPGLGARFTFTLPIVEEAGYVSPVAAAQTTTKQTRRQASRQTRVLAVDDDPQALRYIRDTLVRSDFEAIVTHDPEEALRLMEEEKPHLVLLDLMLPGVDGMDLMTEIRRVADVPVIFVSAYGQDHLVARAFELGAADYVVKPFSATELAARIGAALRRRDVPEPLQPYVLRDLVIDYGQRLVTLAGSPVVLTAIEYRTLAEMAANAGRVSTYEHLLRRIWGTVGGGEIGSLRTVVNTLRRRLGDDAKDPTYIFTELRVGYRMPRPEG